MLTVVSQALYQRALKVRSAVPHPKIMGIIRECGGKMHMSEGKREHSVIAKSESDNIQKTGRRPRATSSRASETTMKLAPSNESKS